MVEVQHITYTGDKHEIQRLKDANVMEGLESLRLSLPDIEHCRLGKNFLSGHLVYDTKKVIEKHKELFPDLSLADAMRDIMMFMVHHEHLVIFAYLDEDIAARLSQE